MDVDVLVQPLAQPRMSKSPVLLPVTSPANGKAKSPTDATVVPLPPSPTSTSPSASALASLLSNALVQVESLKEMLKTEKSRADHFEILAKDYKDLLGKSASPDAEKSQSEHAKGDDKSDMPMDDSRSKESSGQLAAAAEKIRQLRESVTAAEEVRDEEMARRIAITDLWGQLNQYLERLESAGKDVRAGFDRTVKSGGGVLRDHSSMFKDIPQLAEGELMRVDRNYSANGALAPVYPSRRHDYPREERHGTRRPRSGSMDAYAYGFGPNSKRVRYQDEHPHHPSGSGVSPTYYQPAPHLQHPPPGGPSHPLSPSSHIQQHQHTVLQNMPYAQSQAQPPPLATASSSSGSASRHRDRRHADPAVMHILDHQANVYPVAGPPGYEQPYRSQDHLREYHDDRRRRRRDRSRSHSHGRSRSRGSEGSMDLDEMLLATTGDEQQMQANGNGPPGPSQVLVTGRGKGRPISSHGSGGLVFDPRDGSQYVPQASQHSLSPHAQHLTAHHSSQHLGGSPLPSHVVQYSQSQPGPPSGRQSPPFSSSSRPSSSRRVLRSEPTLREDLDRRESALSQSTVPGQVQYQTHVFAPVQTGAPVKKSKFSNSSSVNIAEESHAKSPAPNPAPVVATNSTNSLPLASVNLAPATSPFPPTNEQGQRICRQCGMPGRYKEGKCVEKWGPGPMGPGTVCDRCRKKMKRVERRGTIEQAQLLAAQQAQNRSQTNIGSTSSSYGSFPTPQPSAKLNRTDTVIIDNGRHTFEEPSISSIRSTSNARVVTSSPFNKTSKSGSRPTSKAASRAGSIVDGSKGSRRSSPVPSRSNLSTSMTMSTSRNHVSNASVHSNGSGSGMDIDADADVDAEADLDDAEAEVEGDIAALVDQAAPSPPRPNLVSKARNDEDVDIAVLAGVDDDPDDYDSPATTSALKRQQAARAASSGVPAYGSSVPGKGTGGPSADAELDILEAVDAAEANSASSTGLKVEES